MKCEIIIYNKSKILPQEFYLRPTPEVARNLIGKLIFRKFKNDLLIGKIIETEAYLAKGDPASHSAPGPTKRNEAMFGPGGTLYIYKIYGIHLCANIVCGAEGVGTAVLIRAVEPLAGIELMQRNRGVEDVRKLCTGPGNFAKAFALGLDMNGLRLDSEDVYILDNEEVADGDIRTGLRIGITKAADLPLRYWLAGNVFVSGKR
ncbi:MAG: DNA-3-methyladenine glycosylase [Candidatus Kapaibacterium sp.]